MATLPGFDFTSTRFVAGYVLPGTYNVGIMCTKSAGAEVDKFWNTQLTFATSASDLPNGLTWTVAGGTPGATTTTTTVAGATTTTVAGTAGGTVTPAAPTPGGAFAVTYPNCRVGETVTFSQAQSTPTSVTATCAAASGLLLPAQAAVANATGSFTASPRTAGSYTVNMVGSVSGAKTATFVITVAATPVTPGAPAGGSSSATSPGTIPSTGSSTTSVIVWGILLLVFGRIALLLGRKPQIIPAGR